MILLLVLTVVLIFLRYFLGWKLYMVPKNKEYFNNINNINTLKTPEIGPNPQYVLMITGIVGIAIGLFWALLIKENASILYGWCYSLLLFSLYLIEISRRIELTDESLKLSKFFAKTIIIPLNEIKGMYIYSFQKKFINKHSLTTKLIVSTHNERIKFTISSLNKKAVLNLIKNNFGVTDYKIYVASNK